MQLSHLFNQPGLAKSLSNSLLCNIIENIDKYYPPAFVVDSGKEFHQDVIRLAFGKDGMPVRKVIRRSNYRVTGFLPSRKNGSVQQYESQIELSGLLYLEASPLVESYQVQPAKIHFTLDGKKHFHIPDVLAELVNGTMAFIEFKDNLYHTDGALLARTRYLEKALPGLGYIYLVITPDQMPAIIQANATKLNRQASKDVTMEVREVIRGILNRSKLLSLIALRAILTPTGIGKGEIYQLIRQGDINFDWQRPLDGHSLLTWKESE